MVPLILEDYQCFRAFGLTILSNVSFDAWLGKATGDGTADLKISYNAEIVDNEPLENAKFISPVKTSTGDSYLQIFTTENGWIMRITAVASYIITAAEIQFRPISEDVMPLAVQNLFSNVVAFWFEQRGVRTLHGACVSIHGHSAAFLGDSKTGKSTLSAALLSAGASLVTDDLVAVYEENGQFLAKPAFPRVRLTKPQVKFFLNDAADRAVSIPGLFKFWVPLGAGERWGCETTPQRIDKIYILHRLPKSDDFSSFSIELISSVAAVSQLLRYSFITYSPVALGFAPDRLAFWAGMVARVKVYHLYYPAGYVHLPRIADAVFQHLGSEAALNTIPD